MGRGERGEVGRDEGGEVGWVRGAGRGEGGGGQLRFELPPFAFCIPFSCPRDPNTYKVQKNAIY